MNFRKLNDWNLKNIIKKYWKIVHSKNITWKSWYNKDFNLFTNDIIRSSSFHETAAQTSFHIMQNEVCAAMSFYF